MKDLFAIIECKLKATNVSIKVPQDTYIILHNFEGNRDGISSLLQYVYNEDINPKKLVDTLWKNKWYGNIYAPNDSIDDYKIKTYAQFDNAHMSVYINASRDALNKIADNERQNPSQSGHGKLSQLIKYYENTPGTKFIFLWALEMDSTVQGGISLFQSYEHIYYPNLTLKRDMCVNFNRKRLQDMMTLCFGPGAPECISNKGEVLAMQDEKKEEVAFLYVEPEYKTKIFTIWNVCTDPSYRSKGIMSYLFTLSVEQLFPKDSYVLLFPSNDSLKKYYAKFGFSMLKDYIPRNKFERTVLYDLFWNKLVKYSKEWMFLKKK
jgi:ribosomal protein S18 acetylase RimI-like enzyme